MIHPKLYEAVFSDQEYRLGAASLAARYGAQVSEPSLNNFYEMYNFFGDPAVTLTYEPTLAVGVQTAPTRVTMGQVVTFTLRYTVSAAAQANSLVLQNSLPNGFSYQSAHPAPTSRYGQTVRWGLGNVAAGSYTAHLTATVNRTGLNHNDSLSNQATLSSGNGDSLSSVVNLTVLDEPIAGLTLNMPSTALRNDLLNFSAVSAQGTNVSYQWNFDDNGRSVVGSSVQHSYANSDRYLVTLVANNGVGNQTVSQTIRITDLPAPSFTMDSPILLGKTTVFTATNESGVNYLWRFGDGTAQTTSGITVSHTYPASGIFTATLQLSDTINLSAVVSQAVTVLVRPTARFSQPTRATLGETVTFSNLSDGGGDTAGNLQYEWRFGDGDQSVAQTPSHIYTAVGTYTVQLIVKNRVASHTVTRTISVVDLPLAGLSLTYQPQITAGVPGRYMAQVITGSNPIYVWNFGNKNQADSTAFHTFDQTGNYPVTVTVSNGVGFLVATRNITVTDARPTADFYVDQDIVRGSRTFTATFISQATGTNLNYSWDFGDGTSLTNTSEITVSHVYTVEGQFGVTLTAINGVGSAIAQKAVQIVRQVITPTAEFQISDAVQLGQSMPLLNLSSDGGETDENVSYQWDFGDGRTSTAFAPTLSYDAVGRYTIRLTVSNSVASDSLSQIVQVQDVPIQGLSIRYGGSFLLGGTAEFSATVISGTNVSYQWNLGDGSQKNGVTVSNRYTKIFDYPLTLTATNSTGQTVISQAVTIRDVPMSGLQLAGSPDVELGQSMQFTVSVVTGTNVSYQWDLGDGTLLSTGSMLADSTDGRVVSHQYTTAGTYRVVVTATNGRGSSQAETTASVFIVPPQGVTLTTSGTTLFGQSTQFTAIHTAGTGMNYGWDFGDGNTAVGAQVSHTYAQTGRFTVTLLGTNIGQEAVRLTDTVVVLQLDDPVLGVVISHTAPSYVAQEIQFTATLTGGTNLSYLWSFGDGQTSTLPNPRHQYATTGQYRVVLTLTNSLGVFVSLYELTVGDRPIAGLQFQIGPAIVNQPVILTATTTSGTGMTYNWGLGDGATDTGNPISHIYPKTGTYTITVQAKNSANTVEKRIAISVIEAGSRVYLPSLWRDR